MCQAERASALRGRTDSRREEHGDAEYAAQQDCQDEVHQAAREPTAYPEQDETEDHAKHGTGCGPM
jgi:hypothetical protein